MALPIYHSEAGAQYAYCNMQTRKTISYLIAGHHAGLPDWYEGSGKSLKSILANNDYDEIIKIPQMLLIAAGNVWLGTWAVYRFLAWPTRRWQRTLEARTPAQLLAVDHGSPLLGKGLALIFVIFLGVYASAVIKGAALLLGEIAPLPLSLLIWLVAAYSDRKSVV